MLQRLPANNMSRRSGQSGPVVSQKAGIEDSSKKGSKVEPHPRPSTPASGPRITPTITPVINPSAFQPVDSFQREISEEQPSPRAIITPTPPSAAIRTPIRKSQFITSSPKEALQRARRRAFHYDYYDLHYHHIRSQGPHAHEYIADEKQAIQEEVDRRQMTKEGYGMRASSRTSDNMKRTEAKTMAAQMSNMELLSHFDYIHQGSGAYNSYQRTAIRDELDERPDAREMWMGTDGTHGRGRPEAQ
ncbi:hypothetical protein N7471_005952 [Penicillium samsonianum]|uniref:uncharacterized protein n=1 Tax=Penicillium samsonianum TaxID=1882272 RepID=UPI002546C0B9|nr:uncharacterized protein N7471_005952 [Penicillium samsonianum]KAJ6139466.1 hypothetical protein N7471_005952 [Penicillium samsonianum]